MTITITECTNVPGKLADAEIHFGETDGLLAGLGPVPVRDAHVRVNRTQRLLEDRGALDRARGERMARPSLK